MRRDNDKLVHESPHSATPENNGNTVTLTLEAGETYAVEAAGDTGNFTITIAPQQADDGPATRNRINSLTTPVRELWISLWFGRGRKADEARREPCAIRRSLQCLLWCMIRGPSTVKLDQRPFEAPERCWLYLHLPPESSKRGTLRLSISFDDRSVRLVGADSPG